MSEFDDLTHGAPSSRRSKDGGGGAIIVGAILFGFLAIMTGVGVFGWQAGWFASPTVVQATKADEEVAVRKPTPKPIPTTPKVDLVQQRKEVRELIRADLLVELRKREREASVLAQRIGSMNAVDREQAMACLKHIHENGIENATQEMIALARQIAPRTIDGQLREVFIKSPEYAELVRIGEEKPDQRYPIDDRKRMYREFRDIVGLDKEWSAGAPFNELDRTEMDAVMAAAPLARREGVDSLKRPQWLLLLRAGAIKFVQDQLGKE